MFAIEMLPAAQGDALLIEYGAGLARHRILIDGGPSSTVEAVVSRIERLTPEERHFELLIVTHIDTDHIGGILRLLDDPPAGLVFDDVWFNGWPQLEPLSADLPLGPMTGDAILGPKDGEILDRLLELHVDDVVRNHNKAFDGGPVMVRAKGPLPSHVLGGGMRMTVAGAGPRALCSSCAGSGSTSSARPTGRRRRSARSSTRPRGERGSTCPWATAPTFEARPRRPSNRIARRPTGAASSCSPSTTGSACS